MLEQSIDRFRSHPHVDSVLEELARHGGSAVHGLNGFAEALFGASLVSTVNPGGRKRLLAVFPEMDDAEDFSRDAVAIAGDGLVHLFPERDTHPYEESDSHFEVRTRRVETLDMLEKGDSCILAASIGAIHDPTSPGDVLSLIGREIRTGETADFSAFVSSLAMKGFKRTRAVTAAGEMSVRGGIIDLFPFGGEYPYRIEFWGDEVESIRRFSTQTQRSVETVDTLRILPPDECVTEVGLGGEQLARLESIEREADISLSAVREAFDGGERPNGLEQYLYAIYGGQAMLPAHLSGEDCILLVDPDRCIRALESRMEHAGKAWERHRNDNPNLVPPGLFYPSPETVIDAIDSLPVVREYILKPADRPIHEFRTRPSRQYQGNLHELENDIASLKGEGYSCLVACDNSGQVQRLDDLLAPVEGEYAIGVARISGGFVDATTGLAVFTDHEIFDRKRRRARYRRFGDGVPIPDPHALTMGDFVVHVDYGIGKYMGLRRQTIGGIETDCLLIRYRDNDQLMVPVDQLDRLKRFTSAEGVVPVVSKLGGTGWDKLKERTKKSIRRMAEDLLKLYARRKTYPGFAFNAGDPMMRAMEESFVYEETPDQLKAWADVKKDMTAPAPMDRLLCGDVGFGKTEVAMRAAFLAALNRKQTAVLVPTTILAEQHEETFAERFADFPVMVESISRFKTKSEQTAILDRLARGEIDIVIGTQRLLSKDVHFHDLGLLVIDEEQRFGVRHKERLKKLRSNVDVLSMSATPIPRTLNMSLMGTRDISYINTPPQDRYSVHTEIVPFEERALTEAIGHEIDRSGQVYFVHNRVRSITSMTSYLRSVMPEVSFAVAHGQMPEKQLSQVMHAFHRGDYQVLVSTMIIENGLDIPTVNTIIINRADTFGLAQLYQLRGRVGRSDRRAFAYLLVPPKTPLSMVARQRLRTIEEFVELGSGFNIAMRDLEIRGAGNILGTEQSGFIASVGFDLYIELLHETISELKGETIQRPPDVELNMKGEAYFPESYIPSAEDRVTFYRRLSEAVTADDVAALEEELLDRFGRPDTASRHLIDSVYCKHYAAVVGANEVTVEDHQALIIVPESVEMKRETVERMVKKSPVKLEFSFGEGMEVRFPLEDGTTGALGSVKNVLQALSD